MLDKPIPEAGEFGEKAGFQFLHGGLERFRRVVPRKLAPAREHVHPDVPVEDDPPPPRMTGRNKTELPGSAETPRSI